MSQEIYQEDQEDFEFINNNNIDQTNVTEGGEEEEEEEYLKIADNSLTGSSNQSDIGNDYLTQSINSENDKLPEIKDQRSQVKHRNHREFVPPFPTFSNLKVQKTVSIGWGVLTMLMSGTLYGFTVLSNDIKHKLDYDQTEINEAISIGDVGIYLGMTLGYFYDIFGVFYTCLVSVTLYLVGYLGVWGIVNRTISNKNPFLLSFFLFLVGQASHASFTAAIVSNVHNYSLKHRAKITGCLVGFFAISSGLFSIIYKNTFKKHKNVEGYLLFLALLLSSVTLVGAFLIRKLPYVESDENEEDNEDNDNDGENKGGKIGGGESIGAEVRDDPEVNRLRQSSQQPTLNRPNWLDGKREISGLKLLKSVEFYLMFSVYFFCAGGCLMFLNNIGPLVESLGKHESLASDLVIIFAVSNLTGRISFGIFSDLIAKKYSRFWLVVVSNTIICATHMLFAFTQKETLIIVCVLTGIGYGAMVSLMVSFTSLMFGSQRFGLNFGFLSICSAAGSFLYGLLSGRIYDSHAFKSGENKNKCFGEQCYKQSFIISSLLNFVAIFIGLYLIYYKRKQLIKLINKNIRIYR
ncbi:hypothetical protein DLAC_01161 [Tieghemostelium lacteum]|uniref:Uncharacterized protein n=1 Tax=Tieghemostelium lacteum TaxID=361077 RepID=A0A152A7V7_TIELA|nr:hypothetical protein DLAC_01161 [Tieghemostelium lacteum]|eukprot:KYR02330.1 hypothetical protein DLAC_01161 [Tieghemostelium lacteum]